MLISGHLSAEYSAPPGFKDVGQADPVAVGRDVKDRS